MTTPTKEAVTEAVARVLCVRQWGEQITANSWPRMDAADKEGYLLDAQAAISAHLAALEAEGMVIVPAEPTEAMIGAGAKNCAGFSIESGEPSEGLKKSWSENQVASLTYRAMIAAHKGE